MTDMSLGLAVPLSKEILSAVKNKFSAHDVTVYYNEANRFLENNRFDMALGFIKAAITKASDEGTLLALHLFKCSVLFGQLSMTIGDSITDNMTRMLTPQVMLSERALQLRENAFGAISDALTIDPRCYLAYYLKGSIFLATLDFRNALRAFDDALALEPDQAILLSIYHYQADLCSVTTPWSDADCRDYPKAIDCCEKILQIDPTDETALFLRERLTGGGSRPRLS